MRFDNMQYILWFGLIPLVIGFLVWSSRKRQRDLARLAESSLLERLMQNYRPKERIWRMILLVVGMIFLLVALLGPQWGFQWETVTHRGMDLIIAVDTSKSMLAQDIRPARLERAKLVIQDLVSELEGDRVGLITFAGTSFLQVPLTIDYNALMQGVNALSTETMPQGGTAIGEALENALQAFENASAESKVLILITDGENHLSDPIEIAQKLAAENIQVIVIGMGTTTGELLPVIQDGRQQFVKDQNGNVVKSRLDETLLKEIASTGKGVYISGADPKALDGIYRNYIGRLHKTELSTSRKKNYHQRYQIFLLIGLLLIFGEMLVGVKREAKE